MQVSPCAHSGRIAARAHMQNESRRAMPDRAREGDATEGKKGKAERQRKRGDEF
jgi:hypothetical protein